MEKQAEIKKLFQTCHTPDEKYQKLIELGRILPFFNENWKIPENLVSGCQSQVFLHTTYADGKIFFNIYSDALISAGLAALLVSVYNAEVPEAIIACPPNFLEELGIQAALTPGRSHGLASIHLRMKQEALKFLMHSKN